MISVTVEARAAIEKLRVWRGNMRARLSLAFAEGADTLLALVRAKLSDGVLQTRSGALRASLRTETSQTVDGFAARVWSDDSVPYARIHEYGGRMAMPEIAPRDAKALALVYGGKMVFAKRVAAHTIEIPERSYMRSSLAEFAPAFADSIRKLTVDVA